MDTGAIAGTAVMMNQSATRDGVSLIAMKQAAEAQAKIANMLAQQAKAPQPSPDPNFKFSTYA